MLFITRSNDQRPMLRVSIDIGCGATTIAPCSWARPIVHSRERHILIGCSTKRHRQWPSMVVSSTPGTTSNGYSACSWTASWAPRSRSWSVMATTSRSVWSRTKSRISRTLAVPSLREVWICMSALPKACLLGPGVGRRHRRRRHSGDLRLGPDRLHHVPLVRVAADAVFEDAQQVLGGCVDAAIAGAYVDRLEPNQSVGVVGLA